MSVAASTSAPSLAQSPVHGAQRRCFVSDIGGTHARFATLGEQGQLRDVVELRTREHADLGAALVHYCAGLQCSPAGATLIAAVAAPLRDDRVVFTNAHWDFSCATVRASTGLARLQLVNDFEALALAVPTLAASDVMAIGHSPCDFGLSTASKAILGPGTGMGTAAVVHAQNRWHAVASQGGHILIAPTHERQWQLLQIAMRQMAQFKGRDAHSPVGVEDFLSGTGLPQLHRAVCELDGFDYVPLTPPQITQAALGRSDAGCEATMADFCELLGAYAGDVAIMFAATGGVFLKGGVLDAVQAADAQFLQKSRFRSAFEHKGGYRFYTRDIPTWFITTHQVALRGCATLTV